jgi:hypothetical protein
MRGCCLLGWAVSHVHTCSTVPAQFLELPVAAPLLCVKLFLYYHILYLSRFLYVQGTDKRSHGATSCEWRGCFIFGIFCLAKNCHPDLLSLQVNLPRIVFLLLLQVVITLHCGYMSALVNRNIG